MGRSSGGSSGGGGAVVLIASQVLAAPVPTVTFAAIPGTYNHLKVLMVARSDFAGPSDFVYVNLNGDGGGNYDDADFYNLGGVGVGASSAASGTSFGTDQLLMAAGTATAGTPGMLELDLPYYANTVFRKVVKMTGGYVDLPKSATDLSVAVFLGEWHNTEAVTSLVFTTANAANFVDGSAFYMYGIT